MLLAETASWERRAEGNCVPCLARISTDFWGALVESQLILKMRGDYVLIYKGDMSDLPYTPYILIIHFPHAF